jgi:hypothetical protein
VTRVTERNQRLPGAVVLAGVVVAAAVLAFSAVRYPGAARLQGAAAVLALTVLALAGYAACGIWALRRETGGQRIGLTAGLAGAAMWFAEIWFGGPAKVSYQVEQVTGTAFAALALAVTAGAGILAATRLRQAGAAWRAGVLSGLVSGVTLYVFAVIMTLATLPTLASRSDYQAQFAASHAPDIATYLVGDILAGAAAHLIINLVLGLTGGGLGVLIARHAMPRQAEAAR